MRDSQTFPMNEDARLIPAWSMVAAGIAFAVVEYYWWVVVPAQRHHPPPPLGLRIYFDLSWGLLAALYFLMIGYVSKDAPRRSMSTRFWILICALPGGIGAVLYFLLRLPVTSLCAACGTHVQNDFHFCPQCSYHLTASCGNCFRSVRITDQFCTRCGHELAEDQMPSRLQAFAD